MKIENVKRVTLTDYEVDIASETLYMIKKIAEEFNYDRKMFLIHFLVIMI